MSKIEETGRVTFGQSVKDFFKGYIDFSGRTTRAGFWWMQLLLWIVEAVISLGMILSLINHLSNTSFVEDIFYQSGFETTTSELSTSATSFMVWVAIGIVFFLAMVIPSIAMTVRRFRDAGLSTAGIIIFYMVFIALVLTDCFIDNGAIIHFFVILFVLANFVMKVLPSNCLTAKGNGRVETFLFRC